MKKLIYILIVTVSLTSCYKEEPLTITPTESKHYLEDDPNNPVQHFVYNLYKNYRTILITNPDEGDYKFNFMDVNRIIVTAPEQDNTILQSGIKFLEEYFLNLYNEDFKKKYLPYNIILAKTISDNNADSFFSVFSSTNFIALSHIDADFASLTEEEKMKLSGELNAAFLKSLSVDRHVLEVPDEFYKVSTKYGQFFFDKPDDDTGLYEAGFVGYDPEELAYGWYTYPTTGAQDLNTWLQFIYLTPLPEINTLISTYSKLKQKYELLGGALSQLGLDITKLSPVD